MKFRSKNNGKILHYKVIISLAVCVIVLCVSVLLNGCTGAPPRSAAEEIRLFEWVRTDENDARNEQLGHLTFTGNEMSLTSLQGDNRLDLAGECIIEESTITLISEKCGTIVIGYTLSSDKLTLSYFGKAATFAKK